MRRVLSILLALEMALFLGTGLVFAMLPETAGMIRQAGDLWENSPAEGGPPAGPALAGPSPAAEEAAPSPASEMPSSAAAEETPAPVAEEPPSSAAEKSLPPAGASGPAAGGYAPPQNLPVPEEEWALRLVNWENPLPMDFEPECEEVQNHFVMDKRVAPVARRMILDAWDQGVTLIVNSAYRPYSAQRRVYDARFQKYLAGGSSEEEARRLTESYVAVPGYSEHQLGMAMDIVAVQDSEMAKGWLAAHAPEYGFILRYPEDKTEITHTAYESWHYRYVGVAAAREITARGLCLEEYLAGR